MKIKDLAPSISSRFEVRGVCSSGLAILVFSSRNAWFPYNDSGEASTHQSFVFSSQSSVPFSPFPVKSLNEKVRINNNFLL